ncbi:MAG TPA: PhzF family phenazine biosynthesis protein [Streptosporangiaceae bacterium]|nr:PhzF family phenazine biosynthesis protein [Streptosporangiaceae bacterium]
MQRPFRQVDVFSPDPLGGNPVAVVLDAEGLTTEEMQLFARWTNLSETTFVLPPDQPEADYQVRIFTGSVELPFAGHPTLGTCHAWLEAGGVPASSDQIIQQCEAGLIRLKRQDGRLDGLLGFAAPPLIRSGPVEESLIAKITALLGIDRSDIVDIAWADNGPGWVAVLLPDADAVLELRPAGQPMDVGVVGPYPAGSPQAFEVRAFVPQDGRVGEDPVTGSLNAALAGWLRDTGHAKLPYTASQGTAIGRSGRIHVSEDDNRDIWISGATVTRITGTVDL